MQLYELLFIIVPQVTDAELEKTIASIIESMKKEAPEFSVKEQKPLGRRKFTYPIKHLTEGSYVLIDFEAETEHLQAVNRLLELNDLVLRHMIVKKAIKSARQLATEAKLREEMLATRAKEERVKESGGKRLVQKSEDLVKKSAAKETSPEELEEKLDEILKREIA